jgi:hypothetical protein
MKLPLGRDQVPEMIRVALTDAAYDAIAWTLPKGAARVAHAARSGQCFIQVEAVVVDRMRAMSRPGEDLQPGHLAARRTGTRLRSVASHGNGRALEGQSRDNKIGVALGA